MFDSFPWILWILSFHVGLEFDFGKDAELRTGNLSIIHAYMYMITFAMTFIMPLT